MANVNGFAIPIENADVDVSIATNDRALNASKLDGPGEVPVLIYGWDNCGGNGVKMDPLQRTYPTCDSSGIDLLLSYYFLKTLKKQIIPVKHHQDYFWSRFGYEILHLVSSFYIVFTSITTILPET